MFKSLSAGRKAVFLVTLIGAIAGLVALLIISQKPTYELLYSNLSPSDAGVIISKLKEQKVPYRLSAGGASISVPSEQVYEIRMELASEGLPQGGGVGFEIFDQTKLGMTEFVQTVNYQRALQGELTRTINQLAEVEQSRIHLVIPQKSLFIEDQEEASASVVLKLYGGARLTQNQVQGIVHLVASSVEGLNPEKITVMDNHGKILAGGTEKSLTSHLTNSQVEMKLNLEETLEKRIKTMLERTVGRDKALARVFLTLDFQQTERTEERYDPDRVAVRSEQILGEKSKGANIQARGVPGVESNISDNKGVSAATGTPSEFQKKDETINYEISKTTSHTIEPIGEIKKCSVAVMIDGTYETVKGEAEGEEKKYVPRSEEEMERFRNIVKMAVGYNADRGDQIEVVNMPFKTVSLMEEDVQERPGLNQFWYPLSRYGIIALAIIALFLFVIRPLMRWMIVQKEELEGIRQLPRTVGELEADTTGVAGEKEMLSPKEKVMEIARNDTEQTTQLVRKWLWEGK